MSYGTGVIAEHAAQRRLISQFASALLAFTQLATVSLPANASVSGLVALALSPTSNISI